MIFKDPILRLLIAILAVLLTGACVKACRVVHGGKMPVHMNAFKRKSFTSLRNSP